MTRSIDRHVVIESPWGEPRTLLPEHVGYWLRTTAPGIARNNRLWEQSDYLQSALEQMSHHFGDTAANAAAAVRIAREFGITIRFADNDCLNGYLADAEAVPE